MLAGLAVALSCGDATPAVAVHARSLDPTLSAPAGPEIDSSGYYSATISGRPPVSNDVSVNGLVARPMADDHPRPAGLRDVDAPLGGLRWSAA